MMKNEYYIIAGVVLIVLYIIGLYNRLVVRKNEVQNAFGSIDVMLKKRFDLLPNLVEVTKQYMNHEKDLLTEITALRSQIDTNIPESEKVKKYNTLQKHSENLMLNVENYPELKSNQNFLDLQKAWNTSEEQISASRRFYNTAVTDYNNVVQIFPSNIVAQMFNHKELQVFEATETERENINAKDLFAN